MKDISLDATTSRKSPSNTPNRDLFIKGEWCPDEVQQLIDARSQKDRRPTHLFLGRREADLLKSYLQEHKGASDDLDLEGCRYKGLTVCLHDSESLLRLAGELYMGHLSRTGRHREPIESSSSWWRLSG